ncbi:hypothetical protein C8J57DRAFT_1709997 [Mycena rebaudengoi]|nr:hypothetical protein C8J57DRAFT_1709997 [Mycena rebaudengoi]
MILLLPTVRPPTAQLPLRPTHNRARSKIGRISSASVDIVPPPQPRPWSPTDIAQQWIGLPLRFDILHDRLELEGYQIYAFERDRPVTVLTVYTGDPSHKILVTALRPSATLSPAEAVADWDKAILHLKRDARPRETPHGFVLATSLAHFRSDYTIVHIPHGDFMLARDQLYTNINLLRMGCSGRSALTLEDPSDTTKDRFISTYYLPHTIASPTAQQSPWLSNPSLTSSTPSSPTCRPKRPPNPVYQRPSTSRPQPPPSPSPTEYSPPSPAATPGGSARYAPKSRTKDRLAFIASVLELVKLLQAGLAIFGMFPAPNMPLDGLLCDKTVEGLTTWVNEIGEQCVNVEATERIADPAVVCALLSLVLATRNKLAAITPNVPKDPFLRPQAFCAALAAYTTAPATHTPLRELHMPLTVHVHTPAHSLPSSAAASTTSLGPTVLTRALVELIGGAYGAIAGEGGGRRRRTARALLGRLDGEGSDGGASGGDGEGGQIFTGIGNLVGVGGGGNTGGGAAGVMEASVDLEAFVRVVVGRHKEKEKKKGKEKDMRGAEGGEGEGMIGGGKVKEKDREKDAAVVIGVAGCVRGLWSGLGRKKHPGSIDISSGRDSLEEPGSLRRRPPLPMQGSPSMLPTSFSGRARRRRPEQLAKSPLSALEDPRTPKQFGDPLSAASFAQNLNSQEYDRKLSAFNHKRPWGNRMNQIRIASWSDPVSARGEIVDGDEEPSAEEGSVASGARGSTYSRSQLGEGSVLGDEHGLISEDPLDLGYMSEADPSPPRRRRSAAFGPQRRRSFHQDSATFKDLKILSYERMRIDVELCWADSDNDQDGSSTSRMLWPAFKVLTASLSETNARLREDYQAHVRSLLAAEERTSVIAAIDVESSNTDKITQARNTIKYETQQFQVGDLWHIASPPRHAIFALRDKVFGMGGRRLPPGKHGAHGRFNRLQWTLDGQERLVDYLGRTESEAEEENIGVERVEDCAQGRGGRRSSNTPGSGPCGCCASLRAGAQDGALRTEPPVEAKVKIEELDDAGVAAIAAPVKVEETDIHLN